MLGIIALGCILGGVAVLYILSVIDLRVRLLPNEWVMGFAALGFVFHLSTVFVYLSIEDMMLGALIGGGLLYLIRAGAMFFYGPDALGLGDVKLFAAGGIWLGPYFVLIAMIIGALAGMVHGLGIACFTWMKIKSFPYLSSLSLPAGPGFAVGILLALIMMMYPFDTILSLVEKF